MPYNVEDVIKMGSLKQTAERIKHELDKVAETADSGFKALKVVDNEVKFYNTTDTTKVAVAVMNFPEEIFLDQANTTLIENFSFTTTKYPDATNPNLNGKTVLVLAIKGDAKTNPTVKYSFVNMEKILNTFSAADKSITISGYTIKVTISPNSGNALSLKDNGLYVDISSKSNRAANATAGNVAVLDGDGNVVDSGARFATTAETAEMLNEIFGAETA